MSTLVVEVCEVKTVYPHPNADALEFITVKGWPVIVQKALGLAVGHKVVYFPPDTVMPPELAERLGINGGPPIGRAVCLPEPQGLVSGLDRAALRCPKKGRRPP